MPHSSLLSAREFPHAIAHVDGDAFFASVAQALNPGFRGKPVVTGAERGIISAASYEAKARGVKRGVTVQEARKICPDLIWLPTDYDACSLFAKRMFTIMRRFTPVVEEYSIDEGFADLTGMRRTFHCSYPELARRMKDEIEAELGITVSVGLSLTKSLAKLCSDFRKPSGLTAVPGKYLHLLLERIPLEDIWGVGHNSAALLRGLGLRTALDYARQEEAFHRRTRGKLGVELWHELNGRLLHRVDPELKATYQSMIKSRTFTPASADRTFVLAQLQRNVETICTKMRRFQLATSELSVWLKTDGFVRQSTTAQLNRATNATLELSKLTHQLFDQTFQPDTRYRTTGLTLHKLEAVDPRQLHLFDDPLTIRRLESASTALDSVNEKYGKHTLHLASSLPVNAYHRAREDKLTPTSRDTLSGERNKLKLGLPQAHWRL